MCRFGSSIGELGTRSKLGLYVSRNTWSNYLAQKMIQQGSQGQHHTRTIERGAVYMYCTLCTRFNKTRKNGTIIYNLMLARTLEPMPDKL